MNAKVRKVLEFDKILEKLSFFAASAKAKETIMDIEPYGDKGYIQELLDEVEEAEKVLFVHSVSPSFNFDDISTSLERASVLSVLSIGEILKIGRVLRLSRNLQASIQKVKDDIPKIRAIADGIFIDKKLENDIDTAIISDTEISDNASPELRSIRAKIRKIGENIKIKLNNYVSSPTFSKYLQDNLVTIRNDRYVIPVRAEFRGMIPGLVHDQSASGATLYIEPMAIVEYNNDLKTCFIEEAKEIERILRSFTMRIGAQSELIKNSFLTVTRLDIIFAKAYYANETNSVKPVITNDTVLNIFKGRHPLIDKNKVVANTIAVGRENNLLFITGPNTGGKTVCLKLAGLLSVMALSGMYVPAKEAEIGLFDEIFSDIGDEQSIEQNLSTFSSHITNIKTILDNITDRSLILFDELGAGTDPTEGASLALAISDYIRKKGAKGIITTHYAELKEYAVVTEGAGNASMEFDPDTYSPTFKLTMGTPGASNALLIAERLGLNKEIINAAKSAIKDDKIEFENVLLQLERAKRDIEKNLDEAEKAKIESVKIMQEVAAEREKLKAQRDKLNDSVKKETKKLVDAAVAEANEIIESLRELLDSPSDAALFKAHKLRKELKRYIISGENEFQAAREEAEGDISVGDIVLIKSLNSEGEVIGLNPIKGEAQVKMGAIVTKIKIDNLQKLKAATPKPKSMLKKAVKTEPTNNLVTSEINIIGKASDEISSDLNFFIDSAVMSGIKELKIIHGIGEGILRKAVRAYLARHNAVLDYRDGRYGEGGKGVTILRLK